MSKTAVFPGSFDPITNGHVSIINRGLKIFDKIIIGIGENASKKYMFNMDQRKKWIEETFKTESNVEVSIYSGLTVGFCREVGANFIIRGLRSAADFEFEKSVARVNYHIGDNLETIFLLSEKEYSYVSSSIVRELIKNGGDVSDFVPSTVRP